MKKKILIYGIGIVAKQYATTIDENKYEIIGYLETKRSKDEFNGNDVYELADIENLEFDEIKIANTHYETIEALLKLGIASNKISMAYPLVITRPMRYYNNIINNVNLCVNNTELLINDDYVRYMTLELLYKEILDNNIQGEIAELGVYQGKFSAVLNELFFDRKLYLFDTFDGFRVQDLKFEPKNKNIQLSVGQFSDTNIKDIIGKMKYPKNCIIRAGKFPDTIVKGDIEFAFVSLDCDLYAPILEGLKYFYPRLSNGGYIMLHDYNGDYADGIKKAVKEFELLNGKICKVPIPDVEGTLVITK